MSFDEKQLARTLVEAELMTQDQVERAQTVAKEHGWQLDEAIVREDYLSDEHLGQVIADLVGFPYVNLTRTNVDDHVMRIIPEIVAKNLMLFAYQRDQDGVRVAMADPDNIELQQLIHKRIGEPLHISFATPTDIRNALHHYRKGLKQEFGILLQKHVSEAAGAKAEDIPIIQIVDILIEYAYENHASDIHIEPHDESVVVRFRIDGILHDVASLPKDLKEPIIARVKILSSLRTDEHRAAQDGRFQKKFDDEKVDVRVSIVPISEGEKVVMRLLSQRTRR
ncbi:MAG: Type II secretion system protein E, partial [Parcubacteria group bacterium GW2011_GWA2_48_9]